MLLPICSRGHPKSSKHSCPTTRGIPKIAPSPFRGPRIFLKKGLPAASLQFQNSLQAHLGSISLNSESFMGASGSRMAQGRLSHTRLATRLVLHPKLTKRSSPSFEVTLHVVAGTFGPLFPRGGSHCSQNGSRLPLEVPCRMGSLIRRPSLSLPQSTSHFRPRRLRLYGVL